MATPIKDTPVLMGKTARRFEKMIKENETTRISQESYERIKEAGRNVQIFNNVSEYKAYRASTIGR